MARVSNWPAELQSFIKEHENKAFDWAKNNCALFACNWMLRLTGVDAAVGLRKKCRSAKSTLQMLKDGGGLLKIATERCARFGWKSVPYKFAQRGDLVLAQAPDVGVALGICCGQRAAFPGKSGIVYLEMSAALVTWRIE